MPALAAFTSVATTCSAWRESRSAWIPFPVQTSSARSTGSLMVRCASDGRGAVDARDAVRAVDVEPVGRDQEVVVGDDAHEPVQRAASLLGEARLDEQSACSPAGTGSPSSSSEMSAERPSGTRREPAPVHLEVDVREDRLAGRVQAAGDPGARVAGSRELLPQSRCAAGRRRDGRRLQILTFFDRSQPACTGASREPSAFCGL